MATTKKTTKATPATEAPAAEESATVETLPTVTASTAVEVPTTTEHVPAADVEVITPKLADDVRERVSALGVELSRAQFITQSTWWEIGELQVAAFAANGPGSDQWIRAEVLAAIDASPAYEGIKASTASVQVSNALTAALVFPTAADRVPRMSFTTHVEAARDMLPMAPSERVAALAAFREACAPMGEVNSAKARELLADVVKVPKAIERNDKVNADRAAREATRSQNRTRGNARETAATGDPSANAPTQNVSALATAALESPPAIVAAVSGLDVASLCKVIGAACHALRIADGEIPEGFAATLANAKTDLDAILA